MSTQENKALVRREQQELWNHTGNLDAAEELFAAEQAEVARQEAADYRRGFPDVANTIEDLIAEGDKVVARWRSRATHQGEYMGTPASGKEVELPPPAPPVYLTTSSSFTLLPSKGTRKRKERSDSIRSIGKVKTHHSECGQ